jgi:hypothetical protein
VKSRLLSHNPSVPCRTSGCSPMPVIPSHSAQLVVLLGAVPFRLMVSYNPLVMGSLYNVLKTLTGLVMDSIDLVFEGAVFAIVTPSIVLWGVSWAGHLTSPSSSTIAIVALSVLELVAVVVFVSSVRTRLTKL